VCITTPTERTRPQALAAVEDFWRLLGMQVIQLTATEHDRRLSDVSHLPHAVAAALITLQEDDSLPLAGKGFRDSTRIAGGDGGLWRDIFTDNRDNLRDSIRRLRGQLERLETLLEHNDTEAIKLWLDAAASRRRGLTRQREK
jgi:prephenate dehydrogenase